jgi:hypothetical protein
MSGSIGDNPYRASGVVAAAAGAGGVSWQSITTASTLTAEAGNGYPINTTSNACTVTLPAAASVGDQIIFTDYARKFGTNALTLDPNSLNYQGNSSPNPVYDTNGESIHIVYMDATNGWIPTYDGAVAMETPQSIDIEYLIMGGGGGGGANGGGGGAGGYRTNYGGTALTINQATTFTCDVGTGGAGAGSGTGDQGTTGADSTFSGSGLTTITASGGGGGGGSGGAVGLPGGSGGGMGRDANNSCGAAGNVGGDGGSPSIPEGFAGGPVPGTGCRDGGGGGGASEVGETGVANTPGAGGDGLANSITGSSVTYGGGGGGGDDDSGGTGGAGGAGGGGTGGNLSSNGGDGTDGLGGGAGAAGNQGAGGDGGNGVIILRMTTAVYDTTTSHTGGTATADGSDTWIKWLVDGTFVS